MHPKRCARIRASKDDRGCDYMKGVGKRAAGGERGRRMVAKRAGSRSSIAAGKVDLAQSLRSGRVGRSVGRSGRVHAPTL